MSQKFHITFIHPCIGRRPGQRYIGTWSMEPLPVAMLAALTPDDVEVSFYDDRIEAIPFDRPTDLVAISVEVYTAKRAYQIASEYRSRKIPVVMGGFHATLMPEEVECFAESIVIGEAEDVWQSVIDDYRHGTPKKRYQGEKRPSLEHSTPDRRIFRGKRYLPVRLIEASRGCPFSCDFCSIQAYYESSYRRRPVEQILQELREVKRQAKLIFFVDDNIIGNRKEALELFEAMASLNIRWFSQASINLAKDEELLRSMRKAGCIGVLIGFESMAAANLKQMGKKVNLTRGDYPTALETIYRHNIRVYGTFVFGYDNDNQGTFDDALDLAMQQGFYLCGFNHLTPIPGTPLYARLQNENRLRFEKWWLDEDYSYNQVPFNPALLSAEELRQNCLVNRRRFYSLRGTFRRALHRVNRSDFMMFRNFFPINLMHLAEIDKRDDFPLGDPTWQGKIIPAEI